MFAFIHSPSRTQLVEPCDNVFPCSLVILGPMLMILSSFLWESTKAYIPLRRKIPGVGDWRWAMPLTPEFCIGDTNMLVSWSQRGPLNWHHPPTPSLKFAFYPTRNPIARQWNIGCVGSQRKILALAMYISCFFLLISFALGSQPEPSFQWNMGLRSRLAAGPLLCPMGN